MSIAAFHEGVALDRASVEKLVAPSRSLASSADNHHVAVGLAAVPEKIRAGISRPPRPTKAALLGQFHAGASLLLKAVE